MSLQTQQFYEFADFRLDTSEKVLRRGGEVVPLTPKVFDTLKILIENAGHLLEKEELMRKIWQDRFVEEGNLAFNIKVLRKALKDNAAKPRFIETVQRRGYRFIAEVKEINENGSSAEKKKNSSTAPSQKPYFLISIGIISLISIFGISFIWFGENAPLPPQQIRFTRLTNIGKVTNIVALPDGKSIVFAQKEGIGESLWLQQIETGEQRQILPPQDAEFVGLSVSPDGTFAYYTTFSKNHVDMSLSRIALDRGTPEALSEVHADVSVSFSPDGKRFAYTELHSSIKEAHLKIADADGSNQRVLAKTVGENQTFPAFRASPVAWSPDGETIACVIQEANETTSFNKILLVNPETGEKKYLSEKPWKTLKNIVWKDAENLAFIESEGTSPVKRIWQISRKTGETRQITSDLSEYDWLSSNGENLFTLKKSVFSGLHVAEFAENTTELLPKQILGESSSIENVFWAQNGKIFYNSRTSGKNEIWQINPDGTAAQQLTNGSNMTSSFAVSPIDNSLVFSNLKDGKTVLSVADSNGQNIRQLTDGAMDVSPNFTPDGKTIIFQRGENSATLWQIAADGTQPSEQLTGYLTSNPAVSPDGQTIAYHFMDFGGKNTEWKLGLINSEDRRLLKKLDFPVSISERKTVWHPKGNLLTMIFNNVETAGILLLSTTDGNFRTIENIGGGKINSVAWSVDGSRLVFSQKFEKSDVVSLSDFDFK